MKKLKALALGLVMTLLASGVVAAPHLRITFDPGGEIDHFLLKYDALHQAGAIVVIDGPCISACTLVTAMIRRDRVCVTERATMGFHSASLVSPFGRKHSEDGTALLWGLYPDDVKELVKEAGWDGKSEQTALVFVPFEKLKKVFHTCES